MDKKEYNKQLLKLKSKWDTAQAKADAKKETYETFLMEGNKFIASSDYHCIRCLNCGAVKPKNLMRKTNQNWYMCQNCYSKPGDHR